MAKFNIDDWVRIIPTPDTRSDVWTADHNKFCDKIGKIVDINDEYDDMLLIRVAVHFDYRQTSLYGEKHAWFEDKHLVKSSKWDYDIIVHRNDELDKFNILEKRLKDKRDKILKDIFTREEPEKKKVSSPKDDDEYYKQQWIFGEDWYMKESD